MSEAVLNRLASKFGEAVIETHGHVGNETAVVTREAVKEIALWLRDDADNAFDMMRDVTAVDYLGYTAAEKATRFEVVYHLYSIAKKHSLRLKVPLQADDVVTDTLSDVWAAADWGEREAGEMYGVTFTGHHDQRKLLLYEEFEGFPLRKDYDKRKSQPRTDLLSPERDALAEYRTWDKATGGVTKSS